MKTLTMSAEEIREGAQEALDNWDFSESPKIKKNLEYIRDHPVNFPCEDATLNSMEDKWDWFYRMAENI
jgi:hypothetical protein